MSDSNKDHIILKKDGKLNEKKNQHSLSIPIAVVGMECFFPKSTGLKEYWRLIFKGEDGITEVPSTHWSVADYYDEDPKKPDHVYCKRGGFLDPVPFDPTEFGIPPTILEATDSSQLLALMAAKAALENAGYDGRSGFFEQQRASVILGVTGTQELVIPLSSRLGHPVWKKALQESGIADSVIEEVVNRISDAYVSWQENSFPGLLGNVVAGRISNRLDLGGTNCVIDAACASSLGAVHMSVLELITGRSDMVVTGGVDTLNDIFMHMCFSKTSVLSPTGDARPFSKDADGTVLGEGVGILVLKRLEDAVKAGDRIYAVIKGVGTSSDGKSQSIYAPRPEGQIKALTQAYDLAQVPPWTVELVEAHGTGTPVGDAVEFKALSRFFSDSAQKQGVKALPCALGSVKSMIGHTKAAAGAAGMIKAVLALYNKVLLPTMKIKEPHPDLNVETGPFYFSDQARPWFPANDHPRRAGVSAFGFGGSNFHAVLEEYSTEKTAAAWDGSIEILAFSGKDPGEIAKSLMEIKSGCEAVKTFQEISRFAGTTRFNYDQTAACRLLIIIERSVWNKEGALGFRTLLDDAIDKLRQSPDKPEFDEKTTFFGGPQKPAKIGFVFPGQGAQYGGMGTELISVFPEAFAVLEMADRIFSQDLRLTDFIYPIPTADKKQKKLQEEELTNTDVAQPAIGGISLAMLKIIRHFGLSPDAACGHSFGELVALNAAGWIDDTTLMHLAVHRGRLMALAGKSGGDSGTMLAVKAPLGELDALIRNSDTGVILANRNNPTQGVLSGPTEAIARADKLCKEKGFKTVPLSVAAAFHSHLMKGAQQPFMELVLQSNLAPTNIPVFSNSTGTAYPTEVAAAKTVLGEQLIRHVDFVNNIRNLYASGVRTFLEIGPKTVLSGLIKSILEGENFNIIAVDGSGGRQSGMLDLAKALCRLAALGYPVKIGNWEPGSTPPGDLKKPKMEILISGANYRSSGMAGKKKTDFSMKKNEPPKVPDSGSVIVAEPVTENKAVGLAPGTERPIPAIIPLESNFPLTGVQDPIPIPQPRQSISSDILVHALNVVQEGLKSMQALQRQTAETHQKFLDSQTEANRTLQSMMENTRQWIFPSTGIIPAAPSLNPSDLEKPAPVSQSFSAASPILFSAVPKDAVDELPKRIVQNNPPDFHTSETEIQTVLLSTVSELTGYPEQMLGMDMEIESDLGIDSIKRVEILSTLEEKLPGLPQVEPEVMGTLKTLNQIVSYLMRNIAAPENTAEPKIARNDKETQSRSDVSTVLVETVSELTGYPAEMLGLDMDIESDLGIDSIKRVEILSTLEEKLPGLPPVEPEIMGTLKTLNRIIDYLTAPAASEIPTKEISIAEPVEPIVSASNGPLADRCTVSLRPTRFLADPIVFPRNKKIYVMDAPGPLSGAVADELKRRKIDAELVPVNADFSSRIFSNAAGLIIPAIHDSGFAGDEKDAAFLESALMAAKHAGPLLIASAKTGPAVFAAISFLDGAFGFRNRNVDRPLMGGLAGLVKTAALEWPEVTCRAIDVAPESLHPDMVKSIVDEILHLNPQDLIRKGPVEIGLGADNRYELDLAPSGYPEGQLRLFPGDAVVVTGGARGITAAAALALARTCPLSLVLLGRSPEPFEEPRWLNGIEDEKEVKRAIIANNADRSLLLPELEKRYRSISANREIIRTLKLLEDTGSKAAYYCVDIRDADRTREVMADIHAAYGSVSALIHGAGVLEDRSILDKTPDQFRKVFGTKVFGLLNLLDRLQNDPLKYLVFFSSVAGRMGNKGQVDYAMANEALNKIAQRESGRRENCRVVSLNWGPWDGGMVSSALKKEFRKNHISLIPVEQGVRSLLAEMNGGPECRVEVVLGGMFAPPKALRAGKDIPDKAQPARIEFGRETNLKMAFQREVDIDEYPILKSHILGGIPVVPFALMTEWFGHGALHSNPGLVLQGLDDMRVLKGIRIHEKKRNIRILTGKVKKNESVYEVDLEIRNGIPEEHEIVHSRARAILSDALLLPPEFNAPGFMGANGYSRSVDEIYEKILFHGNDLQGMKEVTTMTNDGMIARIQSASSPAKWMKNPIRKRWVGDPLVLDSAFQMASLWCFENLGHVSLPVYSAAYRQYRDKFPDELITAVLEVTHCSEHKMKGDFTFLDSGRRIIARLSGFEAVVDESLQKAFKPGY